MEGNMCYAMCDSVVLPLIAVMTFIWTAYQEYQLKRLVKKVKI